LRALVGADVARLWPASSASAPLPAPVWSAFFGHPRLFERHVLGIVAGFAGVQSCSAVLPTCSDRRCSPCAEAQHDGE